MYEAIYDEAANKNPLNNSKEGKGKMIGWEIYKTILDLDFLNETEKMQYQAMGTVRGNVNSTGNNKKFSTSFKIVNPIISFGGFLVIKICSSSLLLLLVC